MNFWLRALKRVGLLVEIEQPVKTVIKRTYNAAQANRLTSDWVTQPTAERSERRLWLQSLRARSRDLARNDDYMKQFLRMCRVNIVGKGIKIQAAARMKVKSDLDQKLNAKVEAAFNRWAKKEFCSASGKLSWVDVQNRYVTTLAKDGEVLIRKIYSKTNPFGFTLKFFDVGWLDEIYTGQNPANGNRIVMSVEIDENERPVAYWFRPPIDNYTDPAILRSSNYRVRVPASEIYHDFLPADSEDDTATRGMPWAHTALQRSKILNGYEEAELVAARVGACKGGFLKPPTDKEYDGDEPDNTIEEVEPGMIQELQPGYDWVTYDPTHPNQNYPAFVKSVIRGMASGLGISYNSLANDLEGVNYSSLRDGKTSERDTWKTLQQFMVEHFCEPVFNDWLQSAWLNGQLDVPIEDLQRIAVKFQARGWDHVDPLKDLEASVLAIQNGLGTRTDILAEQGEDFEEVVARLAQEKATLEKAGLLIPPPAAAPAKQNSSASDTSTESS